MKPTRNLNLSEEKQKSFMSGVHKIKDAQKILFLIKFIETSADGYRTLKVIAPYGKTFNESVFSKLG